MKTGMLTFNSNYSYVRNKAKSNIETH